MGILEQAEKISDRAAELVKEGIPSAMALDMAYNEIMKGSNEDEA